jgi:hypothetical protein
VNDVLEQCEATLRLNPHRYDKMGIDVTPMTHWGKGNSALEKAGVPTRKIVLEAIKRWDQLEELTRAEFDEIKAENQAAHEEILSWLAEEGRRHPEGVRYTIQSAADHRRLLADAYAQVEFDRDLFRLRLQRVVSRANVIRRAGNWAARKDLVEANERIDAAEQHILRVEQVVDRFQAPFFAISDEQRLRRREIESADEIIQLCCDDPLAMAICDLDAPAKRLGVSEDATSSDAPVTRTPAAKRPTNLPSPPPPAPPPMAPQAAASPPSVPTPLSTAPVPLKLVSGAGAPTVPFAAAASLRPPREPRTLLLHRLYVLRRP